MLDCVARRGLLLFVAAGLAFTTPMFGQEAATAVKTPAYEVVSIKPDKSGNRNMGVRWSVDRYSATNTTLKLLVKYAYGLLTDDRVSGLPSWADSAHFDIEAKADDDTVSAMKNLSRDEGAKQRQLMMRLVLADRFQLKVHHESKVLPMYALIVAKGGFKLKPVEPDEVKGPDGVSRAGAWSAGNGQLTAWAIPISNLADNLSLLVERQVVDQTGLAGKYNIKLKFAPDDETAMPAAQQDSAAAKETGPSIFTAIQEELGLKLVSTKEPLDTIVIDHVEMPSEN